MVAAAPVKVHLAVHAASRLLAPESGLLSMLQASWSNQYSLCSLYCKGPSGLNIT